MTRIPIQLYKSKIYKAQEGTDQKFGESTQTSTVFRENEENPDENSQCLA
jgi:hypothetical protein